MNIHFFTITFDVGDRRENLYGTALPAIVRIQMCADFQGAAFNKRLIFKYVFELFVFSCASSMQTIDDYRNIHLIMYGLFAFFARRTF